MRISLALFLLASTIASAQTIPAPTDLPDNLFYIKKTWQVGGTRDSLNTLLADPAQLHLFLAYRTTVVVDDLETGATIGNINGTHGAYGMALDDTVEFGYLSDGRFNQIDAFDRRTLKVVGVIPTAPSPSIVLFEPSSELIFAICSQPTTEKPDTTRNALNSPKPSQVRPEQIRLDGVTSDRLRTDLPNEMPPGIPPPRPSPHPGNARPATPSEPKWFITVIDANTWRALADIQLPGKVGFAQTAGGGHVYLGFPGRHEIARLDAVELREKLLSNMKDPATTPKDEQLQSGRVFEPGPHWIRDPGQILDWSNPYQSTNDIRPIAYFHLQRECADPRALAVDEHHLQLFVACGDLKLAVLNADNGQQEAILSTGPDTKAVAYDFDRRLVYAANAGGNGSLTFIRQDVTNTYAVIQSLPTPHWARAMAVNPVTGQIYLMTDYTDSDSQQRQSSSEKGSFQLLLIGH